MRTSNKILLGTFLAILFIITAIHAALYTKYKRNEFVTMTSLHQERYDRYDLNEVRSVSLIGLNNVNIIPADTARLEIEKSSHNRVHYQLQNGVLTIKGDTSITNNSRTERIKSNQDVVIYLPAINNVMVDFAELTLQGNNKPGHQDSITISLNEASLHIGGWRDNSDSLATLFSKINVERSTGSTVDVSGKSHINELNLHLGTSNFDDENMTCDSLFVVADENSSVKITGKNIAKTKFAVKP